LPTKGEIKRILSVTTGGKRERKGPPMGKERSREKGVSPEIERKVEGEGGGKDFVRGKKNTGSQPPRKRRPGREYDECRKGGEKGREL